MRRTFVCILALLVILTGADVASAKKSRSKSSASRSHSKRDTGRRVSARRDKRGRVAATRGKRGRRLARGRDRRGRRDNTAVISTGAPRPAPGIPLERVTEIQNALIKVGYLDGPATGVYDDATIDAVKQYQAQNGWSQTGLPSAPMLKKLGVPKRSGDGYAVPVNAVSETEKKRAAGEKPQL